MRAFSLLVSCVALAAVASAQYSGPTNQAGVDLIKEFEGWYPNFYTDPVGIRTIGYGHACHVWDCSIPLEGKYTPPLTLAQGDALLKSDLAAPGRYESCVRDKVTLSSLNANQFSALASFVFNLGCGNFQSSTLLQLLNAGNTDGASKEFAKWVYGGGVVLPGLVRRREAERVLFCSSGGCGGGGGSCTGVVRADGGLIIRSEPSTSGTAVGSLANGAQVPLYGRVAGSTVSGNSNWFNVGNGYVSAYFVDIVSSGGEAWCAKN